MKAKPRQGRTWLLATAKAVALQLKQHSAATPLRVRTPRAASPTNTGGWSAVIGDLGKSQPRLGIWLDRFTGYEQRKLYACFQSDDRESLLAITKRVSRQLWPTRVITYKDTNDGKIFVLNQRLARSDFNAPILEKYAKGQTFFGIYDPTRDTTERVSPHFCKRAIAFFEDVARALPQAHAADEHRDVYPQIENRQRVASHLQRERSRLLSTERKIMDHYQCQVCGMRFEDVYGPALGREFAETHHLVPLSRLRANVRTRLADLRTVCANCHRMLHHMSGKPEDLRNLRAIVRRHQRKKP